MENSHIVSRYDKNLERIKSSILEMGELVGNQLQKSTEALGCPAGEDLDQLIAADCWINGMYKDVYARSERLIALRQPMAYDLRQALSPISIAGNLERIGDHAKSTAKRARLFEVEIPDPALLEKVQEMSTIARLMLQDALQAYDEGDTALAADIRVRDRQVDMLNKEVAAEAVSLIESAPDQAARCVNLILLARGFERVGDHVVNVARHVHQIVTGDDLKAGGGKN